MAADAPAADTSEMFGDGPRPSGGFLSRGADASDVYELVSNERRRFTIKYVVEHDDGDGVTLDDLATAIAFVESDVESIEKVSSKQRKRPYIGLYQVHLPKLENAAILEVDKRANHIYATDAAETVAEIIDEIEDRLVGDER